MPFEKPLRLHTALSNHWNAPRLKAGFVLSLLLSLGCLTQNLAMAQPQTQSGTQPTSQPPVDTSGPSILHPRPANPEYRYPLDAVDPTAATYPKGVGFPGFRGEQQLIVYTPAFGSSTGTNNAGVELIVENGVISRVNDNGNSSIPTNGFVVSGHGAAANWLSRFGQPGAVVALENEPNQNTPSQLMIRMTPQVFQHQVAEALQRAQSRPAFNAPRYQQVLQEAQSCQAQLQSDPDAAATPTLIALANHCVDLANIAYYNTMESKSKEFRGAWLRPTSNNPADVRKVIESLQRQHINQVFLETYYQGKTIYPSAVMTEYGLQQHPQFRGGDPVQVWVDEAHHAGIKLNLWVQVFFAGNQKENAEQFGPILTKYPQWRNIQRMNLNAADPMPSQIEPGHFFVDPANPEVRAYLQKLILEMVTHYDIDGINLDYIRYPASAAANRGTYLESSWGYTPYAREQFKAMIAQEREAAEKAEADKLAEQEKEEALLMLSTKGGHKNGKAKSAHPAKKLAKKPMEYPSADPAELTPSSPLWPRWVAWRKERVTSFVKEISEKTHAIKPNLLLTAVVFPSLNPVYAVKLQEYPLWISEGYIQALTPIGLSPTPELLKQQATGLRAQIQDKAPIYVGIFGMYNRNQPTDLVRQIDAAHQAGMAGVVVFDWGRLTPDYDTALHEGPFRE